MVTEKSMTSEKDKTANQEILKVLSLRKVVKTSWQIKILRVKLISSLR
jgi:hypothetical protein